jgi:hypothetical protein
MAAPACAHVSLARLNKAMTEDMEVVSKLQVYTVKGGNLLSVVVRDSQLDDVVGDGNQFFIGAWSSADCSAFVSR